MSVFLQFHILTSYPPANLNRDDLGQPKSAMLGGINRIRVSSQSLKRAWRTSSVFEEALSGNVGTRTKRLGCEAYEKLVAGGLKEKVAEKSAKAIAAVFGKLKSDKKADRDRFQHLEIETLVHVGPSEREGIENLIEACIRDNREPEDEELDLLRKELHAADIALFGRMLASTPAYNVDASAQIAHAITVHKGVAESDFFTAVDDLNSGEEDRGSGHMGDTEFAAGLFYLYGCVNVDLLVENLSGDRGLAKRTLESLIEVATTVAPTGKQNSFGSRAYASYCMLERGDRQPRTLSHAFLKPIPQGDMLPAAISALEDARDKMDSVYGAVAAARIDFDAHAGKGSLADAQEFAGVCTEER
jgi:CRISPR system Cascade subunit CasC